MRTGWLNPKSHEQFVEVRGKRLKHTIDPRDGVAGKPLPMDHKQKSVEIILGKEHPVSTRKKIKRVMRSVTSPYEPFEAYYPLEEVIDTYMEIWYQSDSSSSSDS